MQESELNILANLQPWTGNIEILVMERRQGVVSVGTSVKMEVKPAGSAIDGPTMQISRNAAQQLMDQLWQCGLRPSEGSGSAGQLAATQAHLKDMRHIAMMFLEPAVKVVAGPKLYDMDIAGNSTENP